MPNNLNDELVRFENFKNKLIKFKNDMNTSILELGGETSNNLSDLINNIKTIQPSSPVVEKPNFLIGGYEFYKKVSKKLFVSDQIHRVNVDYGDHINMDTIRNKRAVDPNFVYDLSLLNDDSILGYVEGDIFNIVSNKKIYAFDGYKLFQHMYYVTRFNIEKIDFSYMSNGRSLFDDNEHFTEFRLPESFNSGNILSIDYMFHYNVNATSIDITNLNSSNILDMTYVFNHCENLISIPGLESLDTSNCEDMGYMFCYAKSLGIINVSNFKTSKVESFDRMFYHADSVEILNTSGWDTSSCTNMHSMFNDAYKLKSINISNWNTSNVTDMANLFRYCKALPSTTLDFSNWNTSKVTDMNEMFYGCELLTELDISSFDTSKVIDMTNIFEKCTALQTVWVGPNWKIPVGQESKLGIPLSKIKVKPV